MEIDNTRWLKLRDEISAAEAGLRGCNSSMTEAEKARNIAAFEVAVLERDLATHPVTRLTEPRRLPPGVADAPINILLDTQQSRQQQLDAARADLERRAEEVRRLDRQAAEVHDRLGRRRRLAQACIAWANQQGIALPNAEAVGAGRAAMQPSPGPHGQFDAAMGGGAASAAATRSGR